MATAVCANGSYSINPITWRSCQTAFSRSAPRTRPTPGTGDVRILQSEEVLALPKLDTPLVNDDFIPEQQRNLVRTHGGVQRTTFTGAYPFARIDYEDDRLPVAVSLEAYSPFVPLDSDASELPAVIFTFTIRNTSLETIHGAIAATLKNVVGWDTAAAISGNSCSLFGGNLNTIRNEGGLTSLVLENPSLPSHHPNLGQLALSTPNDNAWVSPQWRTADEFLTSLNLLQLDANPLAPIADTTHKATVWHEGYRATAEPGRYLAAKPSEPGETWNGGVSVPFALAARRVHYGHLPSLMVIPQSLRQLRSAGAGLPLRVEPEPNVDRQCLHEALRERTGNRRIRGGKSGSSRRRLPVVVGRSA